MKEIKVDKKYLFSLWIKSFLILFIFWSMVYLILVLLNAINLQIEISTRQDNSLTIFTLFLITMALAGLGCFGYYNLIKKSSSIILEEKGIKIAEGILKRKETFISYKEIKSVHCDDDALSIIDRILKINMVKIHATDTISMPGITQGAEFVNEINRMIELNKETKVDPIVILMEEVRSLKNEIIELKEKMQKIREHKKSELVDKKRKFKLGPFDEIIN